MGRNQNIIWRGPPLLSNDGIVAAAAFLLHKTQDDAVAILLTVFKFLLMLGHGFIILI